MFISAIGLAYSIFRDIVINRMSIWEAASSTGSLPFIFIGTLITLLVIIAYIIFIHIVFQGKAKELSYD